MKPVYFHVFGFLENHSSNGNQLNKCILVPRKKRLFIFCEITAFCAADIKHPGVKDLVLLATSLHDLVVLFFFTSQLS